MEWTGRERVDADGSRSNAVVQQENRRTNEWSLSLSVPVAAAQTALWGVGTGHSTRPATPSCCAKVALVASDIVFSRSAAPTTTPRCNDSAAPEGLAASSQLVIISINHCLLPLLSLCRSGCIIALCNPLRFLMSSSLVAPDRRPMVSLPWPSTVASLKPNPCCLNPITVFEACPCPCNLHAPRPSRACNTISRVHHCHLFLAI